MLRIGHRGARAYAPENTLASFKKALEIGVDAMNSTLEKPKITSLSLSMMQMLSGQPIEKA